ncbi:MAG: YdcH family protein [Pseudomonadota bacterium]
MSEEETLRAQLDALRQEHRVLDEQIAELSEHRLADPLAIRRLKKRKLVLKDQIARIEDQLYPDIIA